MRYLAVLVGTAMLAACGSDSSSGGDETVIEMRGDDGEQVSITAGEGNAGDLPYDFEIYGGATVVSNIAVNQSERGSGNMVHMTSSDSPEEMVEFYREAAEDAGFTINLDMKTQDAIMISGENGKGGVFTFNAGRTGDETSGNLMVGTDNDG